MPGIEVPVAGLIGPDTEDALQQLFLENNWTDKLPIVLPTRERVACRALRSRLRG